MKIVEDEVEERGTGNSWTVALTSLVDFLLRDLGFSNLQRVINTVRVLDEMIAGP